MGQTISRFYEVKKASRYHKLCQESEDFANEFSLVDSALDSIDPRSQTPGIWRTPIQDSKSSRKHKSKKINKFEAVWSGLKNYSEQDSDHELDISLVEYECQDDHNELLPSMIFGTENLNSKAQGGVLFVCTQDVQVTSSLNKLGLNDNKKFIEDGQQPFLGCDSTLEYDTQNVKENYKVLQTYI